MRKIKKFFLEDLAQDLIEYTLLLAFVGMASAALFISSGQSVGGIWSVANSTLAVGAGACNDTIPGRECND